MRPTAPPTYAGVICSVCCCLILSGCNNRFPPLSQAQAGELTRDQAAVLTLRIRRLIAETSYAMLLHSGRSSSPEELQAAFVELHGHATGFTLGRNCFCWINTSESIQPHSCARSCLQPVCANTCACVMATAGGRRVKPATNLSICGILRHVIRLQSWRGSSALRSVSR